jgi:hypothetical protein
MSDPHDPKFAKLLDFLERVPAIGAEDSPERGFKTESGGRWGVGFVIDIDHPLAWETVQELAHVLNVLPEAKAAGAAFRPTSPAPYENGGPEDFLAWRIEAGEALAPDAVAVLLEEHLPKPVEDLAAWGEEDDEDEDDADDDEDEYDPSADSDEESDDD